MEAAAIQFISTMTTRILAKPPNGRIAPRKENIFFGNQSFEFWAGQAFARGEHEGCTKAKCHGIFDARLPLTIY